MKENFSLSRSLNINAPLGIYRAVVIGKKLGTFMSDERLRGIPELEVFYHAKRRAHFMMNFEFKKKM